MSNITEIISLALWVGVIFYMFKVKKDFNQPDTDISTKSFVIIILVSFFVILINGLVLGYSYYKAYNPDYGYEQISKQVNYHVYRPSYIPSGMEQSTKFYIVKEQYAGKTHAVRVAYDIPLSEMIKQTKGKIIVMTQVGVDPNFDIKGFIESVSKGDSTLNIQPISLSNSAVGQAFIVSNKLFKAVDLVTKDNILITIASPQETIDNLQKITNSLE